MDMGLQEAARVSTKRTIILLHLCLEVQVVTLQRLV